ncbi:methyltransferase [Caulobacter segnis]
MPPATDRSALLLRRRHHGSARPAYAAGGWVMPRLVRGAGGLTLHAASIAGHVTAVEKDPLSARLARLNAGLNRLSTRIEVLEGDLYGPVRGRRFDTVVANPPLLPLPEGLGNLPLGDGGGDGLGFTRAVLEGLADALARRRRGADDRCGPQRPPCASGAGNLGARRRRPAGPDQISLLSHRALDDEGAFWKALTHTAAVALGRSPALVQRAYRRHLADLGASGLCHLFVHARHGRGALDVIDLAGAHAGQAWRWRPAMARADA